jgi:hypothetical protein
MNYKKFVGLVLTVFNSISLLSLRINGNYDRLDLFLSITLILVGIGMLSIERPQDNYYK